MGSPTGIIPVGNGDRKEMSPVNVRGDLHGDRDGELKPDGKFPVAIPSYIYVMVFSFATCLIVHVACIC
jgi:hypothetical protein